MTTTQAAERIGKSRSLVIRLCQKGRIAAAKVGRDWQIEEASLALYQPNPRGRPRILAAAKTAKETK